MLVHFSFVSSMSRAINQLLSSGSELEDSKPLQLLIMALTHYQYFLRTDINPECEPESVGESELTPTPSRPGMLKMV